jgi:hypothetical protein
MSKKQTPPGAPGTEPIPGEPAPAPAQDTPQSGGSYTRHPDGRLTRTDPATDNTAEE